MDISETIKLHDYDLEESVLGAVMLENVVWNMLSTEWDEANFFKPANKTIAWAIKDLFIQNKHVDLITITAVLKHHNKLEDVGGAYYISTLSNRVASSANTLNWYRYLQGYTMLRNLAIMGECLKIDTMQPHSHPLEQSYDLVALYEQKLSAITSGIIKFNTTDIGTLNKEGLVMLDKIRCGEIPAGVPIGFKNLQNKLGGWHKTDLIILAARPAMGKTALAVKFLITPAIEHKIPTAMFSLEMSSRQLVMRIQSDLSSFPAEDLQKGNFTSNDINSIYLATNILNGLPVFIDDTPAISVYNLRQRARKLVKENGVQLIIVDYLQLMTAGVKFNNREQEISYISRSLKGLAKELDVPIIALSQLSRDVEKRATGNKRPILSDLRESGAIEQDADMVAFIHRPEYYGLTEFEDGSNAAGKAEILIAKNRHGPITIAKTGFEASNVRFYDLEIERHSFLQPNTNFEQDNF